MENSSARAMENSSALTSFHSLLSFAENDTSVTPAPQDPRQDLASAGLRVATDSVSLMASTLRTTVAGRWNTPAPAHLVVAFWDSPLSHGINVFVGMVLCFTMLGLGCTVELSQLGEHVRRPIGVLLALVCQFVIMPLVAFLLALTFSLSDVAAIAVLLCGCCPGGNLSNIMSLLVNGEMNLSIIMTISSTVLALVLMPLCLWLYSRAWINTPVVDLLPFGAIILTLCSTLIPIGLGVYLRYRYTRAADLILKVSLWSLLVTLVMLFLLTGAMLGPELLASLPAGVYAVAVLMPLAGYAAGYGLASLFGLPPSSRRSVSLETGCQNVQLCTAILKLAFPPQLIGGLFMFPLLYALFQAAEAGVLILLYRAYRHQVLRKPELLQDHQTSVTYNTLKEEESGFDPAYGSVMASDPTSIALDPKPSPAHV
ncbi:sodium/bile acid cotransporter 4 isoform X1 [Conger conger]|uniref:sodium/bile acid cotransporter 4 isoform X1 n=1 Tax=Conger conger TaxID=82655 RepID=UPI002A5A81B8|nr:sodium/bile acid cotransporter 4 isoform X1 [Conger conger]